MWAWRVVLSSRPTLHPRQARSPGPRLASAAERAAHTVAPPQTYSLAARSRRGEPSRACSYTAFTRAFPSARSTCPQHERSATSAVAAHRRVNAAGARAGTAGRTRRCDGASRGGGGGGGGERVPVCAADCSQLRRLTARGSAREPAVGAPLRNWHIARSRVPPEPNGRTLPTVMGFARPFPPSLCVPPQPACVGRQNAAARPRPHAPVGSASQSAHTWLPAVARTSVRRRAQEGGGMGGGAAATAADDPVGDGDGPAELCGPVSAARVDTGVGLHAPWARPASPEVLPLARAEAPPVLMASAEAPRTACIHASMSSSLAAWKTKVRSPAARGTSLKQWRRSYSLISAAVAVYCARSSSRLGASCAGHGQAPEPFPDSLARSVSGSARAVQGPAEAHWPACLLLAHPKQAANDGAVAFLKGIDHFGLGPLVEHALTLGDIVS